MFLENQQTKTVQSITQKKHPLARNAVERHYEMGDFPGNGFRDKQVSEIEFF